jgi:hypothetical protein
VKHYFKASLFVLLVALSSFVAAGQEQKPDEVTALISATRFLEQNPFDKKAKGIRRSAVEWVIATDKVSVQLCSNFLKNAGDKYKYSSELLGQYTIGMAAFKLANPGKDEESAQLAGYESALVSYEAMTKQEPKAKNTGLDGLVAKRADGTLAQYVADNRCKEKL